MDKQKNSEILVAVGMSGGVDSSVTALLLKEQGYKVVGLFMKNWEEFDEHGVCMASKEFKDVERVCEKLDIPYYAVDFIEEYREHVFSHFVKEYQQGYTPNPDILCNREIKFKVFFEKAMELGASYLATGHYAKTSKINGQQLLLKSKDVIKDQTYFLYTLKSKTLEKVLFPLGDLNKSEVRALAHQYDLATKDKKDSTGICFIGERNFKNFLSHYVTFTEGNFENLNGEIIGRHTGASYYTIGQRKGLGLGGQGEPWFVIDKDIERNVVIVERGEFHPSLYADSLTATDLSFVNTFNYQLPYKCKAKIRYRQKEQYCTIVKLEGDLLEVIFDRPQRAITKRQSIVFYDGEVCIGGAMIKDRGPSYFEQSKELPISITNILDH
jgi:tRNA-specific 2-thiouridylase